nr:hypothetical protein [Tanacetum cinerariifolium]
MATTIEQQVALDEALVPSTKRLRIGRSNFRLPSDIQSKESTLQVVYDVLPYVHQHLIRFKMDTRKNIVDLEAFREMLHISPRVSGQSFAELPFKEEILEFLRFLGHSAQIKTLTDVNVNKLFQPWRSFAAVINKCLTGKSSGFNSLRLSQAQILWGLYHRRTVDYAFLIWEDFVYQVEHKNQKKSNEMYCPRFTKVIIHHFMTKKPSIPRRNKVNWHYVRDDILFSTIKVAYKECYACATKKAAPKPKVSARRKRGGYDSSTTPPTTVESPRQITTVAAALRLTAATKGKQPARATKETESDGESEEEETREEEEESFDPIPRTPEDDKDDGNGVEDQGLRISEEERIQEEEEADELYHDADINQGRGLQTNQFAEAVSKIPADLTEMELKKIFIEKMEGNKSIQRSDKQQNLYKALVDAYEADKTILESYGDTAILKRRRRDDDDQEGPFAGSDRGSTTGTQSRQMSASESAFAEEPVQTTYQMDEPPHSVFEIAIQGSTQTWISELAKQADSRSSFNELLDTPIDFSNFIMNRLGVDTLTPELLAGPTYELMRRLCTSLTELEYHLEEVYKATTDQLDWVNPEGQQYPHNLLQPLPLIPDNRGRRGIPFAHFINNDLEYLRGGTSSQKYTTSVTKTKATDYGQIKWIEDLFYGFAVNQESALDVYFKRRIIAVTDLKIVEWHNYMHLDWISVRRDDDKIYKFKEGDFKRLRLQDIEDMLLFLVQGKLSYITVEERFAFNVSLRMFTRSVVIQRRVEDLQLGVESYQKRLNLTKLDTYRSDLKRREAYTAYSNPKGFIYQNKDKKNRLMQID